MTRSGTARTAFTLIELILVMAVLMIVLGVSMPLLKGFFKGRNLVSEAGRFLALTQYGQSRAASEGVPMDLWIDTVQGTYGLQSESTYIQGDTNAVTFHLAPNLQIEIDNSAGTAGASGALGWVATSGTMGSGVTGGGLPSSGASDPTTASLQSVTGLPGIRFLPDGSIGENSPVQILLRQGDPPDQDLLGIRLSSSGLRYEITDHPTIGGSR